MENSNQMFCPCCGQNVEDRNFLADPISNTVVRNNRTTGRLTNQQFRLASYLIQKFPDMATKEHIYDNVFLDVHGEGPEMKIIDVRISQVRPLLAEVGLVIETVWGRGYRLLEADASRALSVRDSSIRNRAPGSSLRWKPEYDTTLVDLMKRKYTVSQCAATMKLPYMTIERHMKILQPRLDGASATA